MMDAYWLDEAGAWGDAGLAPLRGLVRCEVAVVGAGLCGASAALSLSRAGVDVLVLEADRVAGRATGRNAGLILQGTAERYSRAVTLMGAERARALHSWSLVNHAHLAEAVAEEGIDCGYRRGGSLQLAGSPEEEEELRSSAARLEADGFSAEVVEGSALEAVYRAAGFGMGVVLPQDGEVQPVRLVRGVVSAAMRRGARLAEGTRVVAMDASTPGAVRLETASGAEVVCDLVMVCTNAQVGSLLPWFADKVEPVRGQMLATAPAPRLFSRPVYADHGYDYWRQDEAGRVVLGGWRNLDPQAEVGQEERLHPQIQGAMDGFLGRFAGLRGVAVTHRWSGVMGFSRDGLPLVGAAPGAGGALTAVGFTGHGFGFAWLAGEALAAMALEGRHPFAELLSPRRFLGGTRAPG